MMQNLADEEEWYVDFKARDGDGQPEHLLFTPETSQKMLGYLKSKRQPLHSNWTE